MEIKEILAHLDCYKSLSSANKRQVGCLIFDKLGNRILSSGHNFNLLGRDLDCENSEGETFDTVIHAEANAIDSLLTSGIDLTPYKQSDNKLSIYITYSPCMECCKRIVATGLFDSVYFCEMHQVNFTNPNMKESISPIKFLLNFGLKVFKYNPFKNGFLEFNPKKTIGIYHSADSDGRMCKFLLETWIDGIETFGYNYQSDSDWMNVEATEYIFADITPTMEWLENNKERLTKGNVKVVICDHHKDNVNKIIEFKKQNQIGNIEIHCSDDGKDSGAQITYDYLYIKLYGHASYNNEQMNPRFLAIKDLVRYVSFYDTWTFTLLEQTEQYNTLCIAFALCSYDNTTFHNVCVGCSDPVLKNNLIDEIIKTGDIIIKNEQNKIRLAFNNMYEYRNGNTGTQVFIGDLYPSYLLETFLKEEMKKRDEENNNHTTCILYVSYRFDLKTMKSKFSVRSYHLANSSTYKMPTAVEICKAKGGGGHTHAGGFNLSLSEGLQIINSIEDFANSLVSQQ